MRMQLGGKVLVKEEIDNILQQALTILETVGVEVENREMLEHLAAGGGNVDFQKMRVYFGRNYVSDFLQKSEKIQWEKKTVFFGSTAEIFHGQYLDPRDNMYKPWTQERIKEYVTLARSLPNIDNVLMLGYPAEDAPAASIREILLLEVWTFRRNGDLANRIV